MQLPLLALDSWAIMAWLKGEQPAARKVRALLTAADRGENTLIMNVLNLGEVFYLSAKAKNLAYAEQLVESLRARVGSVPAEDELVFQAARLKAKYPLSYADAFAAATAIAHAAPLVTGDPELRPVAAKERGLKLDWLGA